MLALSLYKLASRALAYSYGESKQRILMMMDMISAAPTNYIVGAGHRSKKVSYSGVGHQVPHTSRVETPPRIPMNMSPRSMRMSPTSVQSVFRDSEAEQSSSSENLGNLNSAIRPSAAGDHCR